MRENVHTSNKHGDGSERKQHTGDNQTHNERRHAYIEKKKNPLNKTSKE